MFWYDVTWWQFCSLNGTSPSKSIADDDILMWDVKTEIEIRSLFCSVCYEEHEVWFFINLLTYCKRFIKSGNTWKIYWIVEFLLWHYLPLPLNFAFKYRLHVSVRQYWSAFSIHFSGLYRSKLILFLQKNAQSLTVSHVCWHTEWQTTFWAGKYCLK